MGTEYQLSTIDILNDREFILEMDPPCTYSLAGSEPQATTSTGAHSNNLLDQMVDRMMGCMNQEVMLYSWTWS